MRIEYERACKQAGLPEEKIREIRKVFDADYKRLKRHNAVMKREGIDIFSLEALQNPDDDDKAYDFIDQDMDVESIILHRLEIEKLFDALSRISVKDRAFILDCYSFEWGSGREVAEKYDMTVDAARHKKRRIVENLRKLYFEEY